MAMDKEKLLAWFHTHYLSRQEVLSKLPLGFAAEPFWAELLNRRKARATVLPLYNAAGMPYWYVLTERMISASERLCEEAMEQEEEQFDPYRLHMTSAMTEEMFFTSFVEGAQIPLQEAMDFLQRGTEPENIQEQMIWNNRHAWAEMTATLYRPLDEGFIKGLAYMLTEEMDGCAEDYRQSDNHPIAAMNDEPYDLPASYILPTRMQEYCSFLGRPDIHPLIKSAVGQAYILAIRPFPEGNERLSRMVSSAVLLRSGYDFFRDISLSSAIARESYRYYKCMREILRDENGGDLTYFIEYYLDLLVRAVEAKKERLKRREQQALEQERQLARQPLGYPDNNQENSKEEEPGETGEADQSSEDRNDVSGLAESNGSWHTLQEASEGEPDQQRKMSIGEQLGKWLQRCDRSEKEYMKKAGRWFRQMLDIGKDSFTTEELSQKLGITTMEAKNIRDQMLRSKLIENTTRLGKHCVYRFTPGALEMYELATAGKPVMIYERGADRSHAEQRIRQFLEEKARQGVTRFTSQEWKDAFGLSRNVYNNDLRLAAAQGLVTNVGKTPQNNNIFEINKEPVRKSMADGMTNRQKEWLNAVYEVFGNKPFTIQDCAKQINQQFQSMDYYLRLLVGRGIMSCVKRSGKPNVYTLKIDRESHPECFNAQVTAVSRLEDRVNVPMAASGALRAAAIG